MVSQEEFVSPTRTRTFASPADPLPLNESAGLPRRLPVHSILIHQGGYRAYRTSETTTDCVACRSGKAGVAGAAPENRATHGATFQDRSSCWQGTGQSGDRSATERDRRNRREVEGEVSDQGNGGVVR